MTSAASPHQNNAYGDNGSPDLLAQADGLTSRLQALRTGLGHILLGQENVIDDVLTAILGGGHVLLVGAPGLGKTLLARSMAAALGLEGARIQFTPDLMPSDITGAEIMEEGADGKRHFRFEKGPVFAQLVLADEINRASPRTQAALLEAMGEGSVTQAGHSWPLPRPFHVMATQNPADQEGTYPLPEAQLDRFMLRVALAAPPRQAERNMLLATGTGPMPQPQPLFTAQEVLAAQDVVARLPVSERVLDAILSLVRSLRPEDETATPIVRENVLYGPGPRASQALLRGVKARALLNGRLSPSVEDVKSLAIPVLAHRLGLDFQASAAGQTPEKLISAVAAALPDR
ncbi:MoxR family ATPase [Formicincola oecophyllae]|uniref:MoxR family ATPase n=1 Tax=Formicincola oecophyllae TaxID=2558361 RepID=A0A4Y6U724_9PROT|nr:MoxR family ATPase [Formicincola oecophyllae]QDH13122.1 MoxR family ATPase [Formicincola oecophyllae]